MNPISVLTFELTYDCNLSCSMCKVPEFSTPDTAQQPMTLSDRVDCLQKLAESGDLKMVRILGGEPLLDGELIALIKAIPDGVASQIVTNGVLVDPGMANEIINSGLSSIQFSIDGDEETHDRIRGKGSWRSCVCGLDNLLAAQKLLPGNEMNLNIGFCVNKTNQHCMESICMLAAERGIGFVIYPTIDMDHPKRKTVLNGHTITRERGVIPENVGPYTRAEYREIRHKHRKLVKEYGLGSANSRFKNFAIMSLVFIWDQLRRVKRFSCDRAAANMLLDPWGNAFPCEFYYGYHYGNSVDGLQEIWDGNKRSILLDALKSGSLNCCEICNYQGTYRDLAPRIKKIFHSSTD
jgi:MoaA/NifB/PqqE/SkfB family radical SAM enzyme